MRLAIIGRSEILHTTALNFLREGHQVSCILTAKEAPEYTKRAEHFKSLARRCGASFAQGANIAGHTHFLKKSCAQIGISLNYPGIVPQSVIDLFPFGILNAHGGDLPRYRGNACQSWAILNGESRIGLCIHKMIGDELDSGDIIAREYLEVEQHTKITKVWSWMHERIPALFLQAVDSLEKNQDFILEKQSKNPANALRCYPRRPEDGKIDWSKPAVQILRLINASNKPYAGAFTSFNNKQLIIWDADILDDGENFCAIPGQITGIGETFVDVACGEKKLRLKEVEFSNTCGFPTLWITSIRQRLGILPDVNTSRQKK